MDPKLKEYLVKGLGIGTITGIISFLILWSGFGILGNVIRGGFSGLIFGLAIAFVIYSLKQEKAKSLREYLIKGAKNGVISGVFIFEMLYFLILYPLARSDVPFFGGKLFGASSVEIINSFVTVAFWGAIIGLIVGLVFAIVIYSVKK